MADEQSPPDVSIDGDVNGDLNVAGRDVNITQFIFPWTTLPRENRLWAILGRVVTVLTAISLVIGFFTDLLQLIPGRPFRKAKEGEVLVIVTDFSGNGAGEAATRIYDTLSSRVEQSDLDQVRVERLHGTAPQRARDAKKLGDEYAATLVIWGIADEHGIEPRYEVVRNQYNIRECVDLGVIHADLPIFHPYIAEGMSSEFDYVMLFSLGQVAYFSHEYEEAIKLFKEALDIKLDIYNEAPENDKQRSLLLNRDVAFLYLGKAYFNLGEFDIAINNYNSAIEINPNEIAVYYNLGIAYTILGESEQAAAQYERATKIEPQETRDYYNLGLVYHILGDFDAAIENYTCAIQKDADHAGAYLSRGRAHKSLGELEAAIEDYTRSIQIYPDWAGAYSNRGHAYAILGDKNSAIADYSQAIEIDPDYGLAYLNRSSVLEDPQAKLADLTRSIEVTSLGAVYFDDQGQPRLQLASAYVHRGIVYREQGNYDEALDDFNRAIEVDPNYGLAYLNRAITQEDPQAKLVDLTRSIELTSPSSVCYGDRDQLRLQLAFTYVERGIVYREQGNYDEALDDFEHAIELDENYDWAYVHRGIVYRKQGNYDDALDDFNRAIELDPAYAVAYKNRGDAYSDLGDYEQAIADYNLAIELDPEYASAYNNRAWCLALSDGDLDQALADASRAIELEAEANHYDTRGYVFYKLGEYNAALADYNQAIELELEFSYYGRGLVHEALGEVEKALEDYKRFLITYPADELFSDDARERIEVLGGEAPE